MAIVEWLVVGAGALLVLAVAFGLATGRLNRRAEACCTADPSRDLRMRG